MNDHEKVLPCPFCGSTDAQVGGLLPWLQCDGCGATGPSCDTEAECIAAWNRRAAIGERGEPVAWRYLKRIGGARFAWTRWLGMDELHHYGADGNLVPGPHPDWHKVEYAYCLPTPPTQGAQPNEEKGNG